jgi:predicted amidohydrolase
VRADVGIVGDTVTAVGDLGQERAGRTIDATGLTIAPGFMSVGNISALGPLAPPAWPAAR